MNRAYSILNIKAVKEDERVIEGIASTPTPDRVGDIVEPMGAQFKLPMPLLWQHRASEPVGFVEFAKPNKDGIPFRARIAKIDEPGELQALVDKAWQAVKAQLVRAVSIGFTINAYEILKEGGWRINEWEWLELSLVTIPANADATITSIKSIDAELLAASGRKQEGSERTVKAGVTAKKATRTVKAMEARTMKKTYAEQISSFEATRHAKAAEMDKIMETAAEKGETLDPDQRDLYDSLESDVKEIDEHLKRLRAAEKRQKEAARPVDGSSPEAATESRREPGTVVVARRNVEKGIIFTRYVAAKYLAFKYNLPPTDVARAKFADTPEVELILRAPIAAMNTTDTNAAAPLVQLENAVGEFLELLRPNTIIDRIPGLRRVPFNIKVGRGTQDPTGYWVGQSQTKPVSSMAFDNVTLGFAKIAGIVTQTEELMRFSRPSSEILVRDGLINAVAYRANRDFLDPTKAADDISPASLTNGVTPVTATGTDADALRADLGAMLDAYEDVNQGDDTLVLVMTRKQAGRIGLMRNALGGKEFPDISRAGGFLEGIPVITSNNIVATGGSPADGGLIVAINASSVFLADEGGVEVDISREASLQVDSAPDSPPTGSTNLRSMWQNNEIAIKVERFINWKKGRDGAVQFIQHAKYK